MSDFSNLNTNIGNLRYVQTTPRMVGRTIRSSESATGLGDIIIRSKYNFWRDAASAAAFELELLLPAGDKDNLQGTRETHVTPSIIASRVLYDLIEPHVSLGLDFNANDVDRSSVLYDVGTTSNSRSGGKRLWGSEEEPATRIQSKQSGGLSSGASGKARLK